MRNTWLVIKHEIRNTLGKPSFWMTTIFFPLLIFGLNVGSQAMSQKMIREEVQSANTSRPATQADLMGYVDLPGIVARFPQESDAQRFRAYPDEDTAKAALAAGEIRAYYFVPADFMESGGLVKVSDRFNPIADLEGGDRFGEILLYNLVEDADRVPALMDPVGAVEEIGLAPEGSAPDMGNPMTFIVPYATLFIFFFVLSMSSGFMLQSVSSEKENRTAEVLLLSLRPRELMLGKIIGLGAVALAQMAIWGGGGLLLLDQRAVLFSAAAAFSLPSGFILWAFLYFLLGYLLYASLLGAIGALAPSAREGGQFVFFVMLPLMIPLWLINLFSQSPNGVWVTFLSLFPFSAPTSMVTRMTAATVPAWQPIVGLLILALTTYGVVLLAARFFRADTLLSGTALNRQRLWSELKGVFRKE